MIFDNIRESKGVPLGQLNRQLLGTAGTYELIRITGSSEIDRAKKHPKGAGAVIEKSINEKDRIAIYSIVVTQEEKIRPWTDFLFFFKRFLSFCRFGLFSGLWSDPWPAPCEAVDCRQWSRSRTRLFSGLWSDPWPAAPCEAVDCRQWSRSRNRLFSGPCPWFHHRFHLYRFRFPQNRHPAPRVMAIKNTRIPVIIFFMFVILLLLLS